MQTTFTLAQLADPDIAEADKILRACVHCGFCTATCPTYVLLGDELDSPRGRIYLIKDMLENDRPASAKVATHIDRCLSCLSCMTTCPSGVHYMHLVDHARERIEATYRRRLDDRLLRAALAWMIPVPWRFRMALVAGSLAKPFVRPFAGLLPHRLRAMLALAPGRVSTPSPVDRPQVFPAEGPRRGRVALMTGCAQQVLAPQINEATIRLLTRHGVEVVVAPGAGCCGAVTHHMGKTEQALVAARANIDAWTPVSAGGRLQGAPLDAIVLNTSGCGTTVQDYGFLLRGDPAWVDKAAKVSAMTKDISVYLSEIGLRPPTRPTGLRLAYHAACSLQHGQKVTAEPKALLKAAGFEVCDVPEGHLCCGSAGTYNLLQPEIAERLRDRKAANIARVAPGAIAMGNIGCMMQIGGATETPVLHSVELLDWATGGPLPKALEGHLPPAAATATRAAE
jgi:glycolate oxidase iron-sulfur subunit